MAKKKDHNQAFHIGNMISIRAPKRFSPAGNQTITLTETKGIDFEFHIEGGAVVIDRCEGILPEAGMSMFPEWMPDVMGAEKL